MTEKEKAKAYDEALKKASAAHKDEDRHLKATLERIFPELKESEDERIKKNCIHFLELQKQYHAATFEIEECIAWLETQGEQALSQTNERAWLYLVSDVLTWKDGIGQYLDDPRVQELAKRLCSEYAQKLYNHSNTVKNEQKSFDKSRFKVGDWITIDKPCQIININDKGNYIVQYCDDEKTHELSKNFCESYFHFWTIQDAKDGDVLALSWFDWCKDKNLWEKIIIFKKYHNEGVKGLYNGPCVEGYGNTFKNGKLVFDEKVPYYSKTWICNLQPATKEQRDLLFQKIKEAGYEWDADKKELKKKIK